MEPPGCAGPSRLSRRGSQTRRVLAAAVATAWIATVHAQTSLPGTEPDPGTTESVAELDPELASPRDALVTFLKATEAAQGSDDEQQWEKVYKTLEIPESAGTARRDAALRLKQVLNRLGPMDPEKVAPDADEITEERLERFELFPGNPREGASLQLSPRLRSPDLDPPGEIVLSRDPELGWRFNAETIEAINPLFGWLEERGIRQFEEDDELPFSDRVRQRVPGWAKRGFFLGLEVWQWILLALNLFVAVFAFWLSGLRFSMPP